MLFRSSEEDKNAILQGRFSLEYLKSKYDSYKSEGKDEDEIDKLLGEYTEGTALEGYSSRQIFYVEDDPAICWRIDIVELFNKFGFDIEGSLPYGLTAKDLFGSYGINWGILISSYIDFEFGKKDFGKIRSIFSTIIDTIPTVNAVVEPLITSNPLVQKLTSALLYALATMDIIDENEFKSAVNELVEPYASILSEFKMKTQTRFFDNFVYFFKFWEDEAVWLNDGYVDLNSQLAEGYSGFTKKAKLFNKGNADLFKLAQSKWPIPIAHNLETRDLEIINYIAQNIDLGLADPYYFSYKKVSKEEIYISYRRLCKYFLS